MATTCIVPVSVTVGRDRTDGVWFWALPMETLPHSGVDIVLDYTTITVLFHQLDFADPEKVVMKIRRKVEMVSVIEFSRAGKVSGTMTECVPRKYAMASFEQSDGKASSLTAGKL